MGSNKISNLNVCAHTYEGLFPTRESTKQANRIGISITYTFTHNILVLIILTKIIRAVMGRDRLDQERNYESRGCIERKTDHRVFARNMIVFLFPARSERKLQKAKIRKVDQKISL